VSPCYSNTDVQHCSGGCLDCRQPNANAVCGAPSSTQCGNTCLGSTLSCPGFATKPSCGSWNFESGTTEGWFLTATYGSAGAGGQFGVSTAVHKSGSYSLYIGNSNTAAGAGLSAFSTFEVKLCSSGAAIDLSGKTLSMNIYTAPTTGSTLNLTYDLEITVESYAADNTLITNGSGGDLYPESGSQFLMPSQWTPISLTFGSAPSVAGLEMAFKTYNDAFVGTIYFDDIQLQ
jgi:hypothetical protein